ncbi:UDP-3-O-acyl-N-acetylglucosamine deacetylase [Haliovirga abyssi]|uniref:UDP-3-O-acyl-N-acetylglucosamine deacetylase n=1 Tax=Haliovirga abyssi TaxID=2996794 RepID=A0AAU9DDE2_9FUSO|nr:UDP-3-O-acyl-N-acetylglucosamine deacetylase [Haliovirga abyssi]BDU50342.1 UDP-3-O-acyl-N-acetylglucosamine deacetylase [Haliovirga abyssi]
MGNKRKTIMKEVKYEGIGLHKGQNIKLRLLPAESKSGIIFRRVDVEKDNEIELKLENVFNPTRGTNIINKKGVAVYTIEHFLSALYVYGITDIFVEIDGNEMPIGDGSAFPFIELVDIAGIKEYNEDAEVIEILEPVYIAEEDKYIVGLPHGDYKITYAVNYNHSYLKSQLVEFEINKETFKNDIARARTFGFDYELEYLKSNNLALGGTLENAIVVTNDGVLNPEGLRFEDEFVRHKVLDLVGDLKILNKTIKGHIIAIKAGHALDMKFAKKLSNIIGGDTK